jgi:SAM-dependent methyltransferase
MTIHGWLRYAVFRRLLPRNVESILEIGAGLGAVGARLAQEFRYVGLEPDSESYAIAQERIDGAVLLLTEEAYSSEERFDAVCAFEVLEHIEEDVDALKRWRRHLRADGWLFLSVPQGRYRPTDERQGHFRRYDRDALGAKLEQAGLGDVRMVSYGSPAGYAFLAMSDLLAKRRPTSANVDARTAASGRWLQPTGIGGALRHTAAVPLDLLQRPFSNTSLGTGLVARARVL